MRALTLVTVLLLASCSAGSLPKTSVPPSVAWSSGIPSHLLDGYALHQRAQDRTRAQLEARGVAHAYDASTAGGGLVHVLPVAMRPEGVSARTLVLYDTSGQWGYLGELYATGCANLAGHFGAVDTAPVTAYTAGELQRYNAVIYVGSTYYQPDADEIPPAFYADVMNSPTPVIWINDNVWNFASAVGRSAFVAKYGWDPLASYFQAAGTASITQVTYRGIALTRSVPAVHDAGLLQPHIVSASVSVLATATDGRSLTFPWALRSGNLTYVSEIPFDYVNETDRAIGFGDLLYDALYPSAVPRHRALVRLDGINATSDAPALQSVFSYLASAHIPFVAAVTPQYEDPLGKYHQGKAFAAALAQAPKVTAALQYAVANGGALASAGYTHQYSSVLNPFTGASPDDAEFFRATASAGQVGWSGPVSEDSTSWAGARLQNAQADFREAGLPAPSLWTTPDYFASAADYSAIDAAFGKRIERAVYFSGIASARTVDYTKYIGQFFPYTVTDVYGGYVIPENLGTYGPSHSASAIVAAAHANLAVRDGVAVFSYDPNFGVAPLQGIISQMQSMGYTFTDPSML